MKTNDKFVCYFEYENVCNLSTSFFLYDTVLQISYSRPAKWEGDKEKEGEKKKINLYCNKFARLYS